MAGFALVATWSALAQAQTDSTPAPANLSGTEIVRVVAGGFALGTNASIRAGEKQIALLLDAINSSLPFNQSAVKQSAAPALQGPNPKIPYFTARFALPIPPDNDTNLSGPLLGLDSSVRAHNHSPGFEILPNGDVLAVYFSAKNSSGSSESDNTTAFVQARLRYGAEEWDVPELFFDFKGMNEQSGLLWTDGNTIRFFGGGRGASPWLPFKMATSTNNGATWTLTLPQLDKPASDFTPQPIVNAFRGADGAVYFAMDAADNESFLWRSADDGVHWRDMGGRTSGRHSTVVPLDDKGDLLSIGGKNTATNGWSPMNTSSNWGASWSSAKLSPFPPLGGNQRPCLIRLANGHLCYVSDSYIRKSGKSPDGWTLGQGCFVAISTNNGATWHFKKLPAALPHEADRNFGTLGYVTARQAPNGVIHLLTTMTQPCLHYEFNEAWIFSDAGDIAPENSGGKIRKYSEKYPSGAKWSARICPNGRYLLDGLETTYYENGRMEHDVIYANGRKTGTENFWSPDGKKLWSWVHHPEKNTSTWIHYWSNGQKRIESNWITQPQPRDLNRNFFGLVADGGVYQWNEGGTLAHIYKFANGVYLGELPLPKAQP